MGSRYKNVETGMRYIVDLAKAYGISRRAASRRLETAGIKGVLIGKRAYYKVTDELEKILSKPNQRKKAVEKEKKFQKPLPQTIAGTYVLLDKLNEVCLTVKSN